MTRTYFSIIFLAFSKLLIIATSRMMFLVVIRTLNAEYYCFHELEKYGLRHAGTCL